MSSRPLPALPLCRPTAIAACCLLATIALLATSAAPTAAQTFGALPLDPDQARITAAPHAFILEDRTGQLSFADVRAREMAARFRPAPGGQLELGYSRSTFWIRLTVVNAARSRRDWVLDVGTPQLDDIRVYGTGSPGEPGEPVRLGDLLPFAARPLALPAPAFPFHLESAESRTFWIRVATTSVHSYPLEISSRDRFLAETLRRQWLLGVTLGVLLAVLVYNLFLWLIVQRRTYFYYVTQTFFSISYTLAVSGWLGWLWPGSGRWQVLLPLFVLGTGWSALQFARQFLDTGQVLPRLDRLLAACGWMVAALAAALLILPPAWTGTVSMVATTVSILLLWLTAALRFATGTTAIRIYLVGWSIFLATTAVALAASFGIGLNLGPTLQAVRVGFLVERLLTSLALASHIRELESAKRSLEEIAEQAASELGEQHRQLATTSATLETSEARWHSLLENAPGVIMVCDRQQRILLSNLELRVDNISRLVVSDFVAPETRGAVAQAVEQVFETGQPCSIDVQGRRPDNTDLRWYRSHIGPVVRSGQVQQALCVALDVSRQKEVEQEREELIAELESRNAELERFTYTVSHDLKSPLVTVQGFLGAIDRDLDNGNTARVRADLARIAGATRQMQSLLHDLLELSRIGRVTSPAQRVPFAELVTEALQRVQGQLEERGGVHVDVGTSLPTIAVDRQRLVEVLQNLLENAIKFIGDQPRPRIAIGAEQRNGSWYFFVADNGIGIDPAYHERVFTLFERLEPDIEGTGVGLALVQRIIEVHGGRVWVESEGRGHGTTVCFTLGPDTTAPGSDATAATGSAETAATPTVTSTERTSDADPALETDGPRAQPDPR